MNIAIVRVIAITISFALSSFFATTKASAMRFWEEWSSGTLIMHFDGDIVSSDFDRMIGFITNLASRYGSIESPRAIVALNSAGGNVHEASKIAAIIHKSNQAVTVPSKCASACFTILAAAKIKTVRSGAFIGVHRVYNGQIDAETYNSTALTVANAQELKTYGVPPAIIGQLVTTNPKQIYQLTESDLRSMGAQIIPTAAKGVLAIQPDDVAPSGKSGSSTAKSGSSSTAVVCGEKIDYEIPVDLKSRPSTDQAFFGPWSGSWKNGICGALVVTNIYGDHGVKANYYYKTKSSGKFQFKSLGGLFEGDYAVSMTDNENSTFRFERAGDTLTAHFTGASGQLSGTFERVRN